MVFIIDGAIASLRSKPGDIANHIRSTADDKGGSETIAVKAFENGMSISRYLEHLDPSVDYPTRNDGTRLDAFGRQLEQFELSTYTDPARGMYASRVIDFQKAKARVLFMEYCQRRWREARYGRPANPASGGTTRQLPNGRTVYTSADEGIGTIWRPYFDAATERSSQIESPIQLSSIIAVETPIEGTTYRAAYLEEPSAADLRMYRVAELAEIPLTKISGAQHEVRAYKYGIGYEISYEQIRAQRVDKIGFWIQRAAVQGDVDKVEHALDVAVNGDGNANAATAYDLSDLDPSATIGTLSVRGWMAFKAKMMNAYNIDTVFAREADWLDINMLQMPNSNWWFRDVPNVGMFRNINRNVDTTVGVGLTTSVPVDKLVALDTRFALEHFFEIGANIRESEKFIRNQSEIVVMTETEGFAVLDQKATRVLNVNA